jgi:GTP-binding protein Era
MWFIMFQDIASEHPERFFVGEIVREKIFIQYRQEIPYSCQVYLQVFPCEFDAAYSPS